MHFDFDDLDDPFRKVLEELTKLPPDQAQQVRREVENTRTPLASGDPRRHHYIPQFFLRRFADGDQLAVLRRSDSGRHRLSNVRDLAVIKEMVGPDVPSCAASARMDRPSSSRRRRTRSSSRTRTRPRTRAASLSGSGLRVVSKRRSCVQPSSARCRGWRPPAV